MPLLLLGLVGDLAFEPSFAFGPLTFRFVVEGDLASFLCFVWPWGVFWLARRFLFSLGLSEPAV
jgi:hypothetical protein